MLKQFFIRFGSVALLATAMPLFAADPLALLYPLADSQTTPAARRQNDGFMVRQGAVMFKPGNELSDRMSHQMRNGSGQQHQLHHQRLNLGFFDDAQFEFVIDSATQPTADTLAITAHRPTATLSTLSLTLSDAHYLITFTDPDSGQIYRVVGESASGLGTVTQLNSAARGRVIRPDALRPPQD